MSRRRTILLGFVIVGLLLAVAAWVALHLEGTQRAVWSILVDEVAERTCLELEAESFSYSVWPAGVVIVGLNVTDARGASVSADLIDADWGWTEIVGSPTRLRRLEVAGLVVPAERLPTVCSQSREGPSVDPWHAISIDQLILRDASVGAAVDGLALSLEGVSVDGHLADGMLNIHPTIDTARVERMERALELGGLEATVRVGESGVDLDRFTIESGPLTGQGAGAVRLGPEGSAEGRVIVRADLPSLMVWWDPGFAQRLAPIGNLEIRGVVSWDPGQGLRLGLDHEGPGVELAGYRVERAAVSVADGVLTAAASSPEWGRVEATMDAGTRLDVELELDGAEIRPAAEIAGMEWPQWIPSGTQLSGRAAAGLVLPFALDRVRGSADLQANWPQGRGSLTGTATNGMIDLSRLELEYLGLRTHASATIHPGGGLDARAGAVIDDPSTVNAIVTRLFPELEVPALNGGPIDLSVQASGPLTNPLVAVRASWVDPEIWETGLGLIEATAAGTFESIDWTARIEGHGPSVIEVRGTADRDLRLAGEWNLEIADIAAATALWPAMSVPAVTGSLAGSGEFAAAGGEWIVDGRLVAEAVSVAAIRSPSATLVFRADPRSVAVPHLQAALLGGSVGGGGRVAMVAGEPHIDLQLEWDDLQPEIIVDDLPALFQGPIAGSITASGPLASPSGHGSIRWTPADTSSPLEAVGLLAELEGGTLRVMSESVRIASGPLTVRAELPLGSLPRPDWVLSGAPGGAWEVTIDGERLRLAPILESLDLGDVMVDAIADLEASLQWHPGIGGLPQLQLSLLDAAVTGAGQRFVAQAPVRLAFDGRELVLGDVVLQGEHGHFAVGGAFDTATLEIDATAEGRLDPNLARLIPYPVSIRQPMDISAKVNGPITALAGTVAVDHPGGVIEIRDPPVQIADLHVKARIRGGVLDVDEGQARVNEGTIFLGGGWNPSVNQGLVAELDDVLFLLADGILTKWDGTVAIEPTDDGNALIVGELLLDQGLWDTPIDLVGVFLDAEEEVIGADDITHTIALDLDVRDRGGIHVNNNLGVFDLRWNLLEIWGTVAEPHIGGDINILPGGTIQVAGQSIPLRRGLVQFTGDPLIDPVLEIVPERDIMTSADGKTSQNLTRMATSGLSAGLGTVLGLENTTIRPQDIAIETDSDTSTDFSIGQQLTHSTALFLTTDLRNSQNRTSLLQLWRIPTFPGLTVQAMTRTDPSEGDVRLLQRFSWGGTRATAEQPVLHKVRIEGEWPASKRKLVKASGLVRDQPWDPFLLFLGTVRLERDLAARGFPEASVFARAEGPVQRPIAVFTCETGPRINVEFSGDGLPRKIRSRVVSLYRFPPLEDAALEEMRTVILRHLWSEGHPEAQAELTVGDDGTIHVAVSAGQGQHLLGPILEGAPPETIDALTSMLGSQTELAEVVREPRRADRVVRRVLGSAGYRDVVAVDSWTETLGDSTSVYIRVDPGVQSTVVRFVIEGDDPLGLTTAPDFALHQGMPVDRRIIDRTISNLRASYSAEGFTDAKIQTHLTAMGAPGEWAMRLELDVGLTAQVARVDITGRRHLSDAAVRHGVAVEPGGLFRLQDLDATVGRLATFRPIDRVEASTHQENGEVVVDLNITEKNRWSVEVGGGWNSDRGLTARAVLGDANLFGRGAGATLLGRWEKDYLQGRVIFGLPPLPGGRFNAGIIASYTEDVLPAEQEGDIQINEEIREATVEGTYRLRYDLLTRAYYRFSRTRTYEPYPFDPFWALDITTDLGVLGGQVILDRLDNPFDPRTGYYAGLDLSWAGKALGSDTQNIRALLSTSLALEPRPDWTWFQSLRIGGAHPINGVLDRQSRFYAGGAASIRGFELDSVGPVEVLGGQVIYAGGEAIFVLNEELRIPVWNSLRGAIFVDTGQVWETWSDADFSLAVGAGFGIRWGTPVGPLWADIAWPVANRGLNRGVRYSFGIGRTF